MSPGSMRSVVVTVGLVVWLAMILVFPTQAQEDGEPAEEATPATTTAPIASPPAMLPSPSPAAAAPVDLGFPAPPAVSGGVFGDPLTSDAVFPTGTCPTGDASGQTVGEGFRLLVRGPCVEEKEIADLAVPARGITVWDGDLALDFKVVAGAERAQIALFARSKDRKLIVVRLESGLRKLTIYRFEEGTETALASRDDLDGQFDPKSWSRLALRFKGGEAWVLLDDQPLLYAANVLDQAGGAGLQVIREGNPDDDFETAVVFRDLTLSSVADADPSRASTRSNP